MENHNNFVYLTPEEQRYEEQAEYEHSVICPSSYLDELTAKYEEVCRILHCIRINNERTDNPVMIRKARAILERLGAYKTKAAMRSKPREVDALMLEAAHSLAAFKTKGVIHPRIIRNIKQESDEDTTKSLEQVEPESARKRSKANSNQSNTVPKIESQSSAEASQRPVLAYIAHNTEEPIPTSMDYLSIPSYRQTSDRYSLRSATAPRKMYF